MKSNVVIVTGAAGYIGGQTVLRLKDQGHTVIGIDICPAPNHLVNVCDRFYQEDFANELALGLLDKFEPQAIIHCAGTSLVGPSVQDPGEYYNNNFVKTKILLDYLREHHDKKVRIIFSSSAATYGNPIITPVQEVDPTEPISPYGQSKLMVDWMLASYKHAYDLDYVSFRYFNACGADSQGRHGQRPGATHIIARVLESIRDNAAFTLNGTDYLTPDGTCVRDYIHVEDLVDAHILACDRQIPAAIYNLGTNTGHSNREIINMAEQVTGQRANLQVGSARPGDPAMLTANADKFAKVSDWRPQYRLEDIIRHAWAWYSTK